MPLTKHFIAHPFFYGHPDFYHQFDDSTILQDVSMAQLTGALHQLAHLAAYAAEMFDGLLRISEDTMEGIKQATVRTTKLTQQIEAVEKKIAEAPLKIAPERPRKFRTPDPAFMLITKHTLPPQVAKRYAQAELPPALWMFDVHREDNGRCMQDYSYPGFFFREWFKAEQERQFQQRQQRKKEKQRRKQIRGERRAQRRSAKVENLRKLNWAERYDMPATATGSADDGTPRGSVLTESVNMYARQSEGISAIAGPRSSTFSVMRAGRRSSLVIQPPPMPAVPIEPILPPPFPEEELSAFVEEKEDVPARHTIQEASKPDMANGHDAYEEHKADYAWDDTTITTQFTERNTFTEVHDDQHAAAPVEEVAVEPEPEWHQAYDQMGRPYYYNMQTKETTWFFPDPPQPPSLPSHLLTAPPASMVVISHDVPYTPSVATETEQPDLQADLLMQIRTGKKLRNVEVAPRPVQPKVSLMEEITKFQRTGGLKKAEPIQKAANEQLDDAVARILANRGVIAGSDSEDSTDSDDSDFF